MGGTYIVLALGLIGCGRLEFDERVDAAPVDTVDAAAQPIALACNVPQKVLAIADPSAARMSAVGAAGGLGLAWLSDAQKIPNAILVLDAPDVARLVGFGDGSTLAESYDLVTLGLGTNGTFAAVGRSNNESLVRIIDATTLLAVAPTGIGSPIAFNTSRAVATTGASSGAVYAVIGKNGTQGAIFGVDASNQMVGAQLNIGIADKLLSLIPLGTRIAVLNDSNANNCECRTVPSNLTSVGAPASYATGTCDEPTAAYVSGRSDLLFVTHDFNIDRVEHQILTLSGTTTTLGSTMILQDGASDPRATGNPTGYWTLYRRGTGLEATNISFTGVIGTRVPLGPLSDATGYDVVTAGNDSYALWFSNGLNLVRLCP